MDFSLLSKGFGPVRDFIQDHAWLNGLVQFLLTLIVGYAVYRVLMGERAKHLRRHFSGLARWHGRREIRTLIRAGEYAQAGDRLLSFGSPEQAIQAFLRGNLFGRAADVYLQRHQIDKAALLYERAGEFTKAADLFLERKQYSQAERALERAGRLDDMGELYQKRGEHILAGRAFLRSGRKREAIDSFLAGGDLGEAAKTAERYFGERKEEIGDRGDAFAEELQAMAREAAILFERNGQFQKASDLFLETKDFSQAARCLAQLREYRSAAELYEKSGQVETAAELWALAGDHQTVARLEGERLYGSGDFLDAIAKFQEAGDFHRAADIYRDLHEEEKAALMYERAGEFLMAASIYKEAKRFEDAARAHERAGDLREASECYRLAKQPEKEVVLLEKIGDDLALARNYYSRGLLNEALFSLDRVTEEDPRYRTSLFLRGRIHYDQGRPAEAKDLFERSLKMAERLEESDIDTLYHLAIVCEKTGTESPAVEILEKMLAQDLVEPSAIDRAQNVRKMLTDRALSRMSRIIAEISGARQPAPSADSTAPSPRRYIRVKEIGRGGMGIVYSARDTTLDRIVALKVLPGALKKNEQAVRTFLREAKAAGGLNHPNIVTVYDAGVQESDYYIAMEYIEGKTFKEILRARGRLTYPSVFEVMRQLLSALAYAHSRSVVHRDLTTSNIMWSSLKTVKVMDFGLAKIVKELLSEQSIIGGTPSYMSPEQTLGDPVDHRTDIYSLGVCLYELSLGELPFREGDLGYHHVNTPAPDPLLRDPAMPPALAGVILRCMEKKLTDRFQSVQEIREKLGKAGS